MTNVSDHYKELGQKCSEIMNVSLEESRLPSLSKNHATLFDFNKCIETLKERPEYDILEMALREYQMAILSINLGLYNQAFISLRFFFERTLVAILFSTKEIDLRLWLRGERDTYWQEIIDEDNGVFSHTFYRAFFPELKEESKHFWAMSQKVYRECSEYVHGNMAVQDKIPKALEFNEYLFVEWQTKATTIRRILLFVFCQRYLKFIKKEDLKSIEPIILDEFRHLKPINELFIS